MGRKTARKRQVTCRHSGIVGATAVGNLRKCNWSELEQWFIREGAYRAVAPYLAEFWQELIEHERRDATFPQFDPIVVSELGMRMFPNFVNPIRRSIPSEVDREVFADLAALCGLWFLRSDRGWVITYNRNRDRAIRRNDMA